MSRRRSTYLMDFFHWQNSNTCAFYVKTIENVKLKIEFLNYQYGIFNGIAKKEAKRVIPIFVIPSSNEKKNFYLSDFPENKWSYKANLPISKSNPKIIFTEQKEGTRSVWWTFFFPKALLFFAFGLWENQ